MAKQYRVMNGSKCILKTDSFDEAKNAAVTDQSDDTVKVFRTIDGHVVYTRHGRGK